MEMLSAAKKRRHMCLNAAEARKNTEETDEPKSHNGKSYVRCHNETLIENVFHFVVKSITFLFGGRGHNEGSLKKRRMYAENTQHRLKIVIGLACCILFIGGAIQIYKSVYDFMLGGFVEILLDDKQKLKSVFFSGEPWVIYCTEPKNKSNTINRVVLESRRLLPEVNFGTVDCSGILPSTSAASSSSFSLSDEGKTLRERFGMPQEAVGFVVANLKKPKVLSNFSLKSAKHLVDFVLKHTTPSRMIVYKKEDYDRVCVDKVGSHCLIIGVRGGDEALNKEIKVTYLPNLMKKARKLKVLIINTLNFQVKLDEKILSTKKKDYFQKNVNIICVVNNPIATQSIDKTSEEMIKKSVYSGSFYSGELHDSYNLAKFFSLCLLGTEGNESLVTLDHHPEFNKKKRVLKKNQKKNENISQNLQNTQNSSDIDSGNDLEDDEENEIYVGGPEELRYVIDENENITNQNNQRFDDEEEILEI